MKPNYLITDPKGLLIDGKVYKEGKPLPAGVSQAQIKAYKRFGQIEEGEAPKEEKEPPSEPETVDELKAALEKRGLQIPKDAKKADLEKLYFGLDGRPE